jgi:hypothetical protein
MQPFCFLGGCPLYVIGSVRHDTQGGIRPGLRRIRRVDQTRICNREKTDLEKIKGLKINGKMNQFGAPGRFGRDAGPILERREQRRLDQSLGQVRPEKFPIEQIP